MEDLTRLVDDSSNATASAPSSIIVDSNGPVGSAASLVSDSGLSQTNPVCLRWAKKSLLPARLRPPAASVCLPFFKSPRREILRSR